jgi:transposase InsO family protein
MCAWLGVSRSGYYAWRGAGPSQRSRDDSVLIAVMRKIHAEARGNPGVRRMRAGLAALGHLVPHKRAHRLMQAAGLRGRHPRAWKRTTIGGDKPVPAPDLTGRDFTAALPDRRWCGDVTYIKTWDGWAYLATVIDLYSRKIVGWAIAAHMRTSLVTAALDMAIAARKPPARVIFHSDRGPVVADFIQDRILGPERGTLLDTQFPASTEDQATQAARHGRRLTTELRRISKAQDTLITNIAGIDPTAPAATEIRQRLHARFAELQAEHTQATAELAALTAPREDRTADTALLAALPVLTAHLDELPPSLRAGIYQVIDLHILYRHDKAQATIRAAITTHTPAALTALINDSELTTHPRSDTAVTTRTASSRTGNGP